MRKKTITFEEKQLVKLIINLACELKTETVVATKEDDSGEDYISKPTLSYNLAKIDTLFELVRVDALYDVILLKEKLK